MSGRRNIYLCDHCGHAMVSEEHDKGVTPMFTECDTCGGQASSLCYLCSQLIQISRFMYACPQEILANAKPAIVWHKLSEPELAVLPASVQSHARSGGLLPRYERKGFGIDALKGDTNGNG